MISTEKVRELAEERLTDEMFIVDIKISASNAITILVDSDSGMTIDDCISVSRNVEHNLDRDEEDFSLEVSTPGLTTPFKVLRQYKKYIDREIEVITAEDEELKGILKSATEDGIELEVSRKEKLEGKKKKVLVTRTFPFTFEQIKSAKCVISFK